MSDKIINKIKDYKNSKIYTIRSYQTDKIYIGSTIQPLSARFAAHKCCFKRWMNHKTHYLASFDIIKYDDCYIELLQLCACDTNEELHKLEGDAMINTVTRVNKNIAGRTRTEWLDENKQYFKKYRENNKESINLKRNRKIVCECAKEHSFRMKAIHARTKFHINNCNQNVNII